MEEEKEETIEETIEEQMDNDTMLQKLKESKQENVDNLHINKTPAPMSVEQKFAEIAQKYNGNNEMIQAENAKVLASMTGPNAPTGGRVKNFNPSNSITPGETGMETMITPKVEYKPQENIEADLKAIKEKYAPREGQSNEEIQANIRKSIQEEGEYLETLTTKGSDGNSKSMIPTKAQPAEGKRAKVLYRTADGMAVYDNYGFTAGQLHKGVTQQ